MKLLLTSIVLIAATLAIPQRNRRQLAGIPQQQLQQQPQQQQQFPPTLPENCLCPDGYDSFSSGSPSPDGSMVKYCLQQFAQQNKNFMKAPDNCECRQGSLIPFESIDYIGMTCDLTNSKDSTDGGLSAANNQSSQGNGGGSGSGYGYDGS